MNSSGRIKALVKLHAHATADNRDLLADLKNALRLISGGELGREKPQETETRVRGHVG